MHFPPSAHPDLTGEHVRAGKIVSFSFLCNKKSKIIFAQFGFKF